MKGTPPWRETFFFSFKLVVTSDFREQKYFQRTLSDGDESCAPEVVAASRPNINVDESFSADIRKRDRMHVRCEHVF